MHVASLHDNCHTTMPTVCRPVFVLDLLSVACDAVFAQLRSLENILSYCHYNAGLITIRIATVVGPV